ncbi:MAG: hypothetical protein ACP5GH_05025 [Nitrososphaeria archaeon]|jgi:hypothetical protein
MKLRQVYISTLNGRALYYFTKLMKSYRLPYRYLLPGSDLTRSGLYLTTREENRERLGDRINFEDLSLDETKDILRIASALMKTRSVEVGIDPGKRIGVAVVLGGSAVIARTYSELSELIAFVSKVMSVFDKITVKVGDGNQEVAERILIALSDVLRKDDIMMVVSERHTTPKGNATVRKDALAAVRITRREGAVYHRGDKVFSWRSDRS